MNNVPQSVAGVILAGGLARRMGGGDKSLLALASKTLLQHTIDRAQPQLATLAINANGDTSRFNQPNLAFIRDEFPGNLGPLAGIHAGLKWMHDKTLHTWLASFPCDTPFFPMNLVEKLLEKTHSSNLVVATSNRQTQAVFALWHISLLDKIAEQLASGKVPRLQDWIRQQDIDYVDFSASGSDPFFNINTPEDLIAAEAMCFRKN